MLPDPAGVRLRAGSIRLHSGLITDIALGADAHRLGTPDLGSPTSIIAPGFIDAHVHLPQFACIGVDGLTLLDWLNSAVFPAEARWADPEFARLAAAAAARRLLASGTTGIAAYATVHHRSVAPAMHALSDAGLRGFVGQVLMDQNAPSELLRPASEQLDSAASLTPIGRITPAVTPRFAVSCSRELLEGAGCLAAAKGWPIQTHLSETLDECRLVAQLHAQSSYTDVYRRTGLLTPRTILAHAIHLSDNERAVIANHACVVAHCPTANLFLQAGAMNLAEHERSGLTIAVGSDIAGGPDVAMPRVARAMIETAKRLHHPTHPLPTASRVWHAITAGNALALGFAGAGEIAMSADADIVIFDPSRTPGLHFDPTQSPDPLSELLYQWDDRWITHTLAEGRVVHQSL